MIRDSDGRPFLPKFCYASDRANGNSLEFVFADQTGTLTYTASLLIDPITHVIEASASLVSSRPMYLDRISEPVFPAPQASDEMIDFSGRWCGEFQVNRTPWSAGIRYRENRTGRTGHEHFPGLVVPCRGATNAQGYAYGFHYGWSGGHRMVAEEMPDGRRQIQFGHATRLENEPARRFETVKLYSVCSNDGINGCAVAFQRYLRDRIVRFPNPARPRPGHYNCWKAVCFDHNLGTERNRDPCRRSRSRKARAG